MTSIVSFEPLFPEDRALDALLDVSTELISTSRALVGVLGTPLAVALLPKLRAMNSYYTNKIEGQHTTPVKIEAALKQHYSADREERHKQSLAIAHINAEVNLETQWKSLTFANLFEPERIPTLHHRLFGHFPVNATLADDEQEIVPGALRMIDVTVGRHLAPKPTLIRPLLNVWGQRYGRIRVKEHQLIAIACSHHRLAWIHPFVDGNGRVARLHAHLAMRAVQVTHGLWSPLRGLAREHQQYYARLSEADQRRRNDLDGRGHLSQEGLVRFAQFFIDCCLDQVSFMRGVTECKGIANRMRDLLQHLESHPWKIGSEKSLIKPEASAVAMTFVMLRHSVTRREFRQLLGLSDPLAHRVTRSLLDFGLLASPSHRGDLSFGLPLASLRFLFPRLWPEVDQD